MEEEDCGGPSIRFYWCPSDGSNVKVLCGKADQVLIKNA